MLGQLLNWTPSRRQNALSRVAVSHQSNPPTSPSNLSASGSAALDSVTEDQHTLALLFPSPAGLSQVANRDFAVSLLDAASQAPSGFDELGADSGIPSDADVRVLVAQDDAGPLPKTLLFDSRPPQPPSSPVADRPPSSFNFFRERLPPNDPPSTSPLMRRLSQSATVPRPPQQPPPPSPFFRQSSESARSPGPARGHSRAQSSASASTGLPSLRRLAKDADEELQSCLECMFGSAALRYTGKSTKVHILSKDSSSTSWDRSGGGSSGAFTLQAIARPTTSTSRPSLQRLGTRMHSFGDERTSKKILITRVFSVTAHAQAASGSQNGSVGQPPRQGSVAPRQRRSPVYAVSLLLRVSGNNRRMPKSPTNSDFLNSWSSSLISDSARSSRGSDSMLESTIFDTNFGSLSSLDGALDDEEGMSSVTRHWVVIGRVLDQLQSVVEKQVFDFRRGQAQNQLRRTGSLPMQLGASVMIEGRSPPETMHLPPSAFANDEKLEAASESAATRLGQAFATRQAVSGQDRWAAWKEEARWVDRWARTSEHSTLFTDLLSAFISVHKDWIESIDPRAGRRHARKKGHDMTARTVIVSSNKMKARRFVFLLSAFLPKSSDVFLASDGTPSGSERDRGESLFSPPRSGTRPDLRAEQTAPASGTRHSREHPRRYSSRQLSNLSAAIEMSRNGGLSRSRAGVSSGMSFNSGSPGQDRFTAPTTDLSSGAMPVAHFAPVAPQEPLLPRNRRGSSASARLWDTLQYMPPPTASGSSAASPPRLGSRLGSRRGSGDARADADAGLASVFDSPVRDSTGSTITAADSAAGESKLDQMVSGLEAHGLTSGSPSRGDPSKLSAQLTESQQGTAPRDIPTPRQGPSDPPSMPFSISINEKDGFVDVDIPMDSYGASLQSLPSRDMNLSDRELPSLSSPPLRMAPRRSAGDVSVGGYLQTFSPDLTLQALRPYNNLDNDLRSALAEQSLSGAPSTRANPAETAGRDWSEISTILLANVDTGDLRLTSLRRRRHIPTVTHDASTPAEVILSSRITPDATDSILASAVARTLHPNSSNSTSAPHSASASTHRPSRASSVRARGTVAAQGLGSSPRSVYGSGQGSSGGTSLVGGTPPGGVLLGSEVLRERENVGRVLYEALEDVLRSVGDVEGDAAGFDGDAEEESMLRRGVRDFFVGLGR